jgi:hypothetical protein
VPRIHVNPGHRPFLYVRKKGKQWKRKKAGAPQW